MKVYSYILSLILFLATFVISVSGQDLAITNVTTTPTSCSDVLDGTISFEIVGGTAPYTWSVLWGIFEVDAGGPTTNTSITSIGRRKSNIFRIGVQDSQENVAWLPVTVDGPDPMRITDLITTGFTCNDDNDGSIIVTAIGESGNPVYDLDGPVTVSGNTTGIFSNLPNGSYTVTARDGGSCTSTDIRSGIVINNPDPLDVTIDLVTDVACFGEATGAIAITPSGGTPVYSYAWTGPGGFTSSAQDISGLIAGAYNLILTDANNCNRVFSPLETITEYPVINVLSDITDLSCGEPVSSEDGAIDITITGGAGSFTTQWTGPNGYSASTEDISGLEAGNYSLEITDAATCVRSFGPYSVNEPPLLTATTSQEDNTCFGEALGSIDLTVTGGNSPYTFAWTGPSGFTSASEDLSGLVAGAYSLTITYPTGCSVPFPNIASISQPPEIQVSSVKTDISCGGLSDGAIVVTVSGGLPPYDFSWTGPSGYTSTSEDLSGLGPGAYSLTVTDANNCVVNFPDQETIIEPSSVIVSYVSQVDVLCHGDASGSIEIDVSGGIAPYVFSWSNSSGTTVSNVEDPVGLAAETYSLAVTDDNGCIFSFADLASITEPPVLTAGMTKTDVSCYGAGDGTITVTASGGNGPYEYSSDGFTFQGDANLGPLPPGFYTIVTRDANLCEVTDTLTILEPTEIQIQSETATYLCPGSNLGTISINGTSGGNGPYSYSINGGTDFYSTSDFTGLAPGSYQTVVRDATGCSVYGNLNVLTEPSRLQVASYFQTDISSCSDQNEGRIQVTGTGGTGTISYSLNGDPPVSLGDFQNLPGGSHTITLVDENGCTYDTTVLIQAPPVLSIDQITITDVTVCGGYANGSLDVTGSGGTGALGYSLDDMNYQSSGIFSNLPAGDYTIWMRDANGCMISAPATITEPPPVLADVEKTDALYGSLGSISISNVTGGTPPYEYSINGLAGPFTGTTSYTDLGPATYLVIVRDQNGCTYEETVMILDVPPLDVVINATNVSCFGADDGSIEFVPQDAQGVVQFSIDNGSSFFSEALFEDLPGDSTYQLVALDSAGKLYTGVVFITEPAAIQFSYTTIPALCNAFSETGSIDITVSGGSGSFSYLWSDGSSSGDRTNILAGVYELIITDENNCTRNESITLGSEVTVNADAGEDAELCGESSIQLQGSGNGSFMWDPSPFLSADTIADPVVSGMTETSTFVLTVTETVSPYGCYNIDSVTVHLYPLTGLAVTQDTFVISGSSVQLEVTGGPFEEYRWEPVTGLDNPSVPDPVATPAVPVQYYVYAINSYGCEETGTVFVDVIENIQAYNVFSPNGDGINEYFEIKNSERFPEMRVEVYNRWGDLLFSTVGYGSGSQWDGTARGKDAPVGTYYYIIIPKPGDKPISGNVTIIR